MGEGTGVAVEGAQEAQSARPPAGDTARPQHGSDAQLARHDRRRRRADERLVGVLARKIRPVSADRYERARLHNAESSHATRLSKELKDVMKQLQLPALDDEDEVRQERDRACVLATRERLEADKERERQVFEEARQAREQQAKKRVDAKAARLAEAQQAREQQAKERADAQAARLAKAALAAEARQWREAEEAATDLEELAAAAAMAAAGVGEKKARALARVNEFITGHSLACKPPPPRVRAPPVLAWIAAAIKKT